MKMLQLCAASECQDSFLSVDFGIFIYGFSRFYLFQLLLLSVKGSKEGEMLALMVHFVYGADLLSYLILRTCFSALSFKKL